MTTTKSFRIEDDLMNKIDQGVNKIDKSVNFTALVNQAIRQYYNQWVWIPNFHIEEHACLTASQLLERTRMVEYLRHSDDTVSFTFYPTSKDEIARNKKIHEYANGNYNALHDGFVYFNIKFPLDFLFFLKSRTWNQVEQAVHGFLSMLYWLVEDKQHILDQQLERTTLKRISKILDGDSFKNLTNEANAYNKEYGGKARAKYNDVYFSTLIDLGIDPLIFRFVTPILQYLHHPFHFHDHITRLNSNFAVNLPSGYMRDIYEDRDDWQSIIVKGDRQNDNLQRAESSDEPWKIWVSEYTFYHGKGNSENETE